jgi:hypothetical protein
MKLAVKGTLISEQNQSVMGWQFAFFSSASPFLLSSPVFAAAPLQRPET